jgi:hypothetical protein
LTTITEGDEVEVAAKEGITRTPEGFYSVALDGSVSSDVLQYKTHQHTSKTQYEKEKCLSTLVPGSSSTRLDELSSAEACLHQQMWHVTFGETLQICVHK